MTQKDIHKRTGYSSLYVYRNVVAIKLKKIKTQNTSKLKRTTSMINLYQFNQNRSQWKKYDGEMERRLSGQSDFYYECTPEFGPKFTFSFLCIIVRTKFLSQVIN